MKLSELSLNSVLNYEAEISSFSLWALPHLLNPATEDKAVSWSCNPSSWIWDHKGCWQRWFCTRVLHGLLGDLTIYLLFFCCLQGSNIFQSIKKTGNTEAGHPRGALVTGNCALHQNAQLAASSPYFSSLIHQ